MVQVNVLVTWADNYGACCDLVPGCVATHATLEGVKESFRTALAMHLEGMQEDGEIVPEEFRGDYQLCFNLNTRALLHATEGIITRSALSKFTGINERQLGHYATGRSNPRPAQQDKIVRGIHSICQALSSIAL